MLTCSVLGTDKIEMEELAECGVAMLEGGSRGTTHCFLWECLPGSPGVCSQ